MAAIFLPFLRIEVRGAGRGHSRATSQVEERLLFLLGSRAGTTTTFKSIVRPDRVSRFSKTVSFPHKSSSSMPGSLHGFNGPEVVSRFAELAGLWQAAPQNAKKKSAPASALSLAEQKERRFDMCATLPARERRNNSKRASVSFILPCRAVAPGSPKPCEGGLGARPPRVGVGGSFEIEFPENCRAGVHWDRRSLARRLASADLQRSATRGGIVWLTPEA